jgi:uncharacterized membrane protein
MRLLNIAESIAAALGALPGWLVTVFISMLPFVELRLSIPVAIGLYGMEPIYAYVIAILGNLIPIPFLLLFLGKVEKWLSGRYKRWERFFIWLFKRTRNRASNNITKYEMLGLTLYVAIPLPVTGAWTGALIAYLFDLDLKKAFVSITAGVLIAGVIVTAAVVGVISLWGV